MTDSGPILVFDSGISGLSVLKQIRALLPRAPIVRAADSAGYPYGTKSAAEVAANHSVSLAFRQRENMEKARSWWE